MDIKELDKSIQDIYKKKLKHGIPRRYDPTYDPVKAGVCQFINKVKPTLYRIQQCNIAKEQGFKCEVEVIDRYIHNERNDEMDILKKAICSPQQDFFT